MEEIREYIDLRKVFSRIWENRKRFFITLPIVFVVACAFVLCIPRYYTTDVSVVPEMDNGGMGGTLGDMASLIGIDLSNMQTSDAITPLLYPDLMNDNGFVADLFNIRVKSSFDEDMPIDTTYYAYMRKFQKKPFWVRWYEFTKKTILPKKKKFEGASGSGGQYDPYCISEDDFGLMERMRDNISINIDKKTAVITIGVRAQDPFICRQLADSVTLLLQEYITQYRTNKVRTDLDHYKLLMESAKQEYDSVRQIYARFADANRNAVLTKVSSELSYWENEVSFKYNTYTANSSQYQLNLAKLQARTPVFTTLKGAMVPIKPAGPKRMLIVAGLLVLSFICQCVWIMKEDIKKQFNHPQI